jgi:homoserine O-acetyltransferase
MSRYYTQENHGPYHIADIGDLPLEEGGCIRGAKLAYATHGALNAAKDNAVLVTTWYSGTSKIMEQLYIGEGRALDPAKYFIIIVNQLGSGLSSSPGNTDGAFAGPHFPRVRIGDDVAAQHRLLTEHLGLTQLALVFGGSMGAQQAYEWAARHPDFVKRAAALAGTARNRPSSDMVARIIEDILTSDPGFNGGRYAPGAMDEALRRHGRYFGVVGWSPAFLDAESWKPLGFNSLDDFLTGFMEAYFLPMDPNNLLAMAWKWRRGDVGRAAGGDLSAALGRITAKVMALPIETDLFFPPDTVAAEAALIPGAEVRTIRSKAGHLGLFAVEPDWNAQIDAALRDLLAR